MFLCEIVQVSHTVDNFINSYFMNNFGGIQNKLLG